MEHRAEAIQRRRERPGYLAAGGDFATGISQEAAEELLRNHPDEVMGYTFAHGFPGNCWVKKHGTSFVKADGWTTVELLLPREEEEHRPSASWTPLGHSIESPKVCKTYECFEANKFRVFVEKGCVEMLPAALELLCQDIAEICRLLPGHALSLLQEKAGVWVNESLCYPVETDYKQSVCCAHWDGTWPQKHGDLFEKGGCVEVFKLEEYLDAVDVQPAVLLHELAHSYHAHRMLEVDGVIRAAYNKAERQGIFGRCEYMGRIKDEKPYSATNHMEYFAETSEAFFSSQRFRNDFFPYVHTELRASDPIGYRMCIEVWGVSAEEMPCRVEIPRSWQPLAKVKKVEAEALFKEADLSGHGFLQLVDLVGVAAKVLPKQHTEDLGQIFHFADADKDGRLTFREFWSWLTYVLTPVRCHPLAA